MLLLYVYVVFNVKGVGRASQIWVQDFLWWWSNGDSSGAMSFKYQSLDEKDVQNCDLETFSNLKLYINPGGNAYNQVGESCERVNE